MKLSPHQKRSLSLFPEEGWHRVDMVPMFWLWVRHREHTAKLLYEKGYLEWRVKGQEVYDLYSEYRKVLNPPN